MERFFHKADPLAQEEWGRLLKIVTGVSNATIARRFIQTTGPLGAGVQTVPNETLVGITEGYKNILGDYGMRVVAGKKSSEIVPIISKDFVLHWRDVGEARQTGQPLSFAKAAAAAASCARTEDKLVFYGHSAYGYEGLMTVEGRNIVTGLHWGNAGDAFDNFTKMTRVLEAQGYNGPYAAVVHPNIYADMHRVLEGSSLLEISHVKALLTAGVFKSSLLAPRTGLVVSTGKENLELIISVDASIAFLGARQMNLPFRVFKAIYLRILQSDAICTF